MHKDRPLLPDRRDPSQAMPRRVVGIYLRYLGAKAGDPWTPHYSPYSMRIGHATHLWISGVPELVASRKFRWDSPQYTYVMKSAVCVYSSSHLQCHRHAVTESADSRKVMFNRYGTKLPMACVYMIRGTPYLRRGYTSYSILDALRPTPLAWRCGHSLAVFLRIAEGSPRV